MRCVFVLIVGFSLAPPSLAVAGTLKGSLLLPPRDLAKERVSDRTLGYWRLENGRIPIAPPLEPRGGTVVVLVPLVVKAPREVKEPKPVTVELRAASIEPRTLAIATGTTLVVHNGDREPRTLRVDRNGASEPVTIAPDARYEIHNDAPGELHLGDSEHEGVRATALILDRAIAARVDERNDWKVEAPDGKYTLKVFARGAWMASQTVDVKGEKSIVVKASEPPPAPSTGGAP